MQVHSCPWLGLGLGLAPILFALFACSGPPAPVEIPPREKTSELPKSPEPPRTPATEGELAADAAALAAALPEDLQRALENRLRILDVAAHPDDEDGGLLLTHRLQGAETVVVFSTRGEGGQNASGRELGIELGERREQETLAAQRILGATTWFLGFPDFGFSKRADETFEVWGGKDEVVRRLTHVIRAVRPHRVFTNHGKTQGHGHHQATSIALHEAIVAAADPTRFPEQLAIGLAPWRADALFVRFFDREKGPPPDTSLAFDYDLPSGIGDKPIAGIAHDALLQHVSQGPWSPFDAKAKHKTSYVMAWTPPETRTVRDLPEHRHSLGEAMRNGPFTIDDLLALLVQPELLGDDAPSAETRAEWLRTLLGIDLFFPDEDPEAPREALAPGDALPLFVLAHGRDALYRGPECAEALRRLGIEVTVDEGSAAELVSTLRLEDLVPEPERREVWRDAFVSALALRVREEAPVTFPSPVAASEPSPASRRHPLALRVTLKRDDVAIATLRLPIEKAIAPAALVELSPSPVAILRTRRAAAAATMRLVFPAGRIPTAPLVIGAPEGVDFVVTGASDSAPTSRTQPLRLDASRNLGTSARPRFEHPLGLLPRNAPEKSDDGRETIAPLAVTIAFEDGAPIAAASGAIAWIDVEVPKDVHVAFVVGPDGSLADALDTLGIPCRRFRPDELEKARLEDTQDFTTVVLDVRTLGTSESLRKQSARLRAFAEAGGHVVVLYHKPGDWNRHVKDGFTPAPVKLELTDRRICEEQGPVRVLLPNHDLMLRPNRIGERDFEGWVQERALYVPFESYHPEFVEILAGSDQGEPTLRGLLLGWTSVRGGSFTWCSLALTRQVRAGHAGGWKLLANLVGRPAAVKR